MNEGWIKLQRKLKEWEWYKDSKMVHLFIHLLLSANIEKRRFRGYDIEKGQLVCGLKKLNDDTGISEQSLRTCIKKLKSTGELTVKSTNEFTVVTLVNYEFYQGTEKKLTGKSTGKLTNEQQTTNKRLTTIKEEEERKEEVYRSFAHLQISINENQKILNVGYSQEQINSIYDAIENYRKNSNYSSLYLTSLNWLKKEFPTVGVSKDMNFNNLYTSDQLRLSRSMFDSDGYIPESIIANDAHRKQLLEQYTRERQRIQNS